MPWGYNEQQAYHVLFVGFMGSGKTTVARRLAQLFSRRCIDLDRLISRRAGMDIPSIFEKEGEQGFRDRETAALESLFLEASSIVSCGGGITIRERNRELLKSLGTVIYLKVDADEAVSRISRPETRPLLSGDVPPREILQARAASYQSVADICFDTAGKSIDEVVNTLGELLWKKGIL